MATKKLGAFRSAVNPQGLSPLTRFNLTRSVGSPTEVQRSHLETLALKDTPKALEHFYLDETHGFVRPDFQTTTRLPEFEQHEALFNEIAQKLKTNPSGFYEEIQGLPQHPGSIVELISSRFSDRKDRHFVKLHTLGVLAYLASAYVSCNDLYLKKDSPHIHETVALPLTELASNLGLNPWINYVSTGLHNWRLVDETKPVTVDNMIARGNFTGSVDESWFMMMGNAVEIASGKIPAMMIETVWALKNEDDERVMEMLAAVAAEIKHTTIISRMKEHCDPDYFYNEIRTWIKGTEVEHHDGTCGVVYRGVSEEPKMISGSTAAQSPLFFALDAYFNIEHGEEARDLQLDFLSHLLEVHREFIDFIWEHGNVWRYVDSVKEPERRAKLEASFNDALGSLTKFKTLHIGLVHRYIVEPAKKMQKADTGTGGSSPIDYLKMTREDGSSVKF